MLMLLRDSLTSFLWVDAWVAECTDAEVSFLSSTVLALLSWFLLRAAKNDILILLKLSFILIKDGLISAFYMP